MKWEVNNGIINKLFFNNQNIILPWGFETSDSYSFYSQYTKGNGNNILREIYHNEETNRNSGQIEVQMAEGKWCLDISEKIDANSIHRKHETEIIEESYMFDYVQRYRFKKEHFKFATIDGKQIKHKNSNIYYQYKTNSAKLIGQKYNIEVKLINFTGVDKFQPVIYVRDYNDEWIIHVRLWPIDSDKNIIKLCVFWYNKAIPQFLSNIILTSNKIKDYLWVRGERKPYKRPMSFISPCVYPQVLLKPGTKLMLESELSIILKNG